MTSAFESVAELATVTFLAEERPAPPDRLTDEEAAIWRLTVSRLPGSWFTVEMLLLLESYCGHIAASRRFTAFLDNFEDEWVKVEGGIERLNKLAQMRERETKAATAIARALRITKSAQTEPHSAYRVSRDAIAGPRPWD